MTPQDVSKLGITKPRRSWDECELVNPTRVVAAEPKFHVPADINPGREVLSQNWRAQRDRKRTIAALSQNS